MPKYIKILRCESKTAWYANKAGFIYKLDPKVEFPNVYTIRITKSKHKANWGTVNIDEAVVFFPGLFQQFIIWIKGSYKTKVNG